MSQSPGVPGSVPPGSIKREAAELPAQFDIVFPHPIELRSVFVRAARASGAYRAEILAWDHAQQDFRSLAHFSSNEAGPFSVNIGSASFAPARAERFRLVFQSRRNADRIPIEALRFCSGFRVSNWASKAGFSTETITPQPGEVQPEPADVIPPQQVVDLTGRLGPDGRLNWSVPAGRWTILRLGHTPTGVYLFPTPVGGAGLDCDKFSRKAADFHYDHCVKSVLQNLGPDLARRAMAFYHVDSYESGWQNWSAGFSRDFRERRHYDLTAYIPALTGRVVQSLDATEKFLWDVRRTIGDLFADNNYGRFAERCHEDGIGFSTEPYGGPFEQLQVGLRADHPMTEIWVQGEEKGAKLWFQAVMSGRMKGVKIVGAESFTSEPPAVRWNEHPFSLKPLGDFIYCCGVNQYCIHVSTQQPLIGEHLRPGFTCGLNGIHFDRGNTWWQHGAKEWLAYATRCQSLLQSGEHVADVLYFQGNDSPSGVGPNEPALPEGYDFDVCNAELLEAARVRRGRVTLPSGKSYGYLVLPSHGRVTLASLRSLAALARSGARLAGTLPRASPSLSDHSGQQEYRGLLAELAPHVSATQPFHQLLAADGLQPDFTYDHAAGQLLHYTHRQVADAEIYFVANASQNAGFVRCTFRVTGKSPELWSADTGATRPCPVYEQSSHATSIPLHFEPAGSVFVVFRPRSAAPHAIAIEAIGAADASAADLDIPAYSLWSDHKQLQLHTAQSGAYAVTLPNRQRRVVDVEPPPKPQPIQGPWTIQFPAGWGAPEQIMLRELLSWPDHTDSGVRHFSGTATYKTTFHGAAAANGCRVLLDLGRVEVIAEVWLNGKPLGTFWKPPFVCDVTGLLQPNANELEVRVTNLWPNRLIGDEQFPDDCTPDGTWLSGVIPSFPAWLRNGHPRPEPRRLTFCTWKHWSRNDALLPSGWIGPVRLRQVRTVTLPSA
jgi:hypothetical protein